MKKYFVLLVFFSGVWSVSSFAIVGGERAGSQYPEFVQLWFQENESDARVYADCGGVLITPNKVLTAAHCISGEFGSFSKLYVSTGLNDFRKPGFSFDDLIEVSSFVIPKQYSESNGGFDIGILVLPRNVSGSTASIYSGTAHPSEFEKEPSTVVGTGTTSENDNTPRSRYLKKSDLLIDSEELCAKVTYFDHEDNMSSYNPEDFGEMCAGPLGSIEGACKGDSGSPVFSNRFKSKRVVIGTVVSGDTNCDTGARYSIYSKINDSVYINFIKTYAPRAKFKTGSPSIISSILPIIFDD